MFLQAETPPGDTDFDRAVDYCARVIFVDLARDNALDPSRQAEAYDQAAERCRKAIGALVEP